MPDFQPGRTLIQPTRRMVPIVGGILVFLVALVAYVGAAGASTRASGSVATSASSPQTPAQFYKSHQLVLITDQGAGSSFDITLRNVAQTLDKLAGIRTVVRDLGQAGGIVGDNSIYTAKPDGTTIGLVNFPGTLESQWAKTSGISYDVAKFVWLGRVADYPPGVMIASSLGSISSIINSGKTIKFAMESQGDDSYVDAQLISNILHFPASFVTGYGSGSEETTAVLRGEVDATIFSYTSELSHLAGDNGAKIAMVISSKPVPKLQALTLGQVASQLSKPISASDQTLVKTLGSIYSLERLFAAPPGTPPDRVKYLEQQLQRVFVDKGFLGLQQKAGYPVNPLSARDTQLQVASVVKDKAVFLAAQKKATKG
jgi:tripartite-type tricarboxylate transporter receptor subunit TctC